MKKEIRSLPGTIEIRGEGEQRTLVSIAPPWDTLSVDLGGFKEKFDRGAFGELDGLDVISTFEHDGRSLLGRTPKTLRLFDSEEGLRYEVDLPNTSAGRDVAENVELENIRGSSFEFFVKDFRSERLEDGTLVRVVTEAELLQVGPVTNPAYREGTDVALRSLEELEKDQVVEEEATEARDKMERQAEILDLTL